MDVSNSFLQNEITLADITTYQVGVFEAAAHRAMRQYKDALLSDYGLTGADWYLIGTVFDAGRVGIRSSDLAKQLSVTMGFLTKQVSNLEAKNILRRTANATDARSSFITLNSKYIGTLREIEASLRQQLRSAVYRDITPQELTIYLKVLQRLRAL